MNRRPEPPEVRARSAGAAAGSAGSPVVSLAEAGRRSRRRSLRLTGEAPTPPGAVHHRRQVALGPPAQRPLDGGDPGDHRRRIAGPAAHHVGHEGAAGDRTDGGQHLLHDAPVPVPTL